MAFDTLGVNVVASGIRGVASDIAKLAGSFMKYVGAVKQADAASVKAAQSQSKLADTMVNKTQKNIKSLETQYDRLVARANTLRVTIDSLNMTMRNPVSTKANYDKAIRDVQAYTAAIKKLESAIRYTKQGQVYKRDQWIVQAVADLKVKLAGANVELQKHAKNYAASIKEQDRLTKAVQAFINVTGDMKSTADDIAKAYQDMADAANEAADKHDDLTEAQNKLATGMFETENVLDAMIGMLNDSSGAASGLTSIISKLVPGLSSLSGGMGATGGASASLASALGISVGALAAIASGAAIAAAAIAGLVISFKIMKAAAKLVVDAMKIVIKVIQTAWQVFKKLASVVWDVAAAIGKTLWNAIKKIATAPFNLVSKLFGNMGGSMQRVLEMAIGMNLSRIWWQLGMKMRDMFKTATDAAIEFQVTYTRLDTLMKNEVIGKLGPTPSEDEYNAGLVQATRQTKELIAWTSKLAVLTIFGAEDILNVYTLAMSYGFASTQAERLTEAVLDFASGMGLGDTEMERIIENFGQMRAQGKITGTELRDLARGSFVPVNDILEQMAKNAGLVGDYNIPNMQAINAVLQNMADNGELTADAFASIDKMLKKLGADGKITRTEFETLVQDLSKSDVMEKFGLTAEQAGKALEAIKTGQLTEELNQLIKTGKLTIDEFFDAFIEMVEDKYPNAAKSMGLTMKAVKSNIEDYIATMIGWRLIAPVFEVVAEHVQNFIQNTLMTEKQIANFDRVGKALKVITELLMTYSEAMRKVSIFSKLWSGPFAQVAKVFEHFTDIIGKLGTEEFDFKKVLDLSYLLKAFGMSGESRNAITTGISTLNRIMKDIIAGVEIDPAQLKKALGDVFGTIWKDFFGPKIKEGIDLAWTKHIAPAIGRLWQKMKDKFAEWKTEKLIPGIKKFFGETLPSWISSFGRWITEEGPRIVLEVGKFVSDILAEFIKITAFHFGEDNPLTRLLVVLEELFKYGALKIADPTSSINADNAQNLADAFGNLGTSLKNAFFETDIGKKALSWINGDEFRSISINILTIVGTIGDLATVILGPFKNGMDEMGNIDISDIIRWMRNLSAMILQLAGYIQYLISYFLLLYETLTHVPDAIKGIRPFGKGSIFKQFFDGLNQPIDSQNLDNMRAAIDIIKKGMAILDGEDLYGATEQVDAFIESLKFDDIPPLNAVTLEQPFAITATVDANLPAGIYYDEDTGTYVQNIGVEPPEEIIYTQPFTINGELNFENLPAGYTYNDETGLLEFDPIIYDMTMKTLPIIELTQPIEVNGKVYHNLPPGFSVDPATNKLQWTSSQGEIVTDPIEVEQRLQMSLLILGTPGYAYNPLTGEYVYTPPGQTQKSYTLDPITLEQILNFTPEITLTGDAPQGFSIDENGNPTFTPPAGTTRDIVIPPANVEAEFRVTPQMILDGTAGPGWYLDDAGHIGYDWSSALKVAAIDGVDPIEYEVKVTPELVWTKEGWTTGEETGYLIFPQPVVQPPEPTEVFLPLVMSPQLTTESGEAWGGVNEWMKDQVSTVTGESVPVDVPIDVNIQAETANAQQVVDDIIGQLTDPLSGLADTFTAAGANAVQGLWNGMASVMAGLIEWWKGQVAYLNSIVPTMNQQNSPSRLYRSYGEDMMAGLQLGLESGQAGAVAQMHDAAIELRQALGAIGTGTISPQQYNNVSNTTNWNVNVTTPLVASTPIQAYEILRMRAR